jgi:DNA-binding CsgD family transcriptional regulator
MNNQDIFQWTESVLTIQGLSGSKDFYPKLNSLLAKLADFDEILIVEFTPKSKTRLLWQRQKVAGDQLELYLNSAYVLDPFYRLGVEANAHGFFRLADIMPADFREYEHYYHRYFRHLKIVDEIGYLIQIPDDTRFIHIEMANFVGSGEFSNEAKQHFKALFVTIEKLVLEHHAILKEQDDLPLYETSYVEDFHRLFGTQILTPREHDVTLLMLQGYSVKAIAMHLGIGDETIKMHRKNIYSKLDVGSQSELLALFIDLLVMVEPPVMVDPLVAYVNRRKVA